VIICKNEATAKRKIAGWSRSESDKTLL